MELRPRFLKLPPGVIQTLGWFSLTRVVLIVAGILVISALPTSPNWKTIYDSPSWLSMWAVWDSRWYLEIAAHGYALALPFDPSQTSALGFFPLFPALVWLASVIVRSPLVAGVLVSNLALFGAGYVLYQLTRLDYDEAAAKLSVKFLFLLPAAYVLSGVFAESLSLLLGVSALYLARTRRWWPAGVCGLLLALTKSTGILIMLPLAILAWQSYAEHRRWLWRYAAAVVLPAVGLGLFSAYQYFLTGDFLAYSHVQQGAWGHIISEPVGVIIRSLMSADFATAVNGWFLVGALAVVVAAARRRLPVAYWTYAAVMLLAAPATGQTVGSIRYLSALFVLPMALAVLAKREYVNQALTYVLTLTQGCLFVFWILSYWFVS